MFQKIAKHRANDASNDVHRPPLQPPPQKNDFWGLPCLGDQIHGPKWPEGVKGRLDFFRKFICFGTATRPLFIFGMEDGCVFLFLSQRQECFAKYQWLYSHVNCAKMLIGARWVRHFFNHYVFLTGHQGAEIVIELSWWYWWLFCH